MNDEMDDVGNQVWLSIPNPKKSEKPLKTDVIITDNEDGIKLIFKLFKIIKSEISNPTKITEDVVFKSLRSLLSDFQEDQNLEQKIRKKIKKLEKHKFYNGFIEVSGEEILNQLNVVRDKRIEFWNSILKKFIKDKVNYNNKLKNYFNPKKSEI